MYYRLILFLILLTGTINAASSYFEAGDTIELERDIHGNQTVIGAETLIHSNVEGDLLIISGSCEISGKVQGKTTIFAGNISLRGVFLSDLTVYGGNIAILPECKIYGKLQVFGANTEFMGEALSTSQFMSSNLHISGSLEKQSRIYATKIVFTSTALVNSTLIYTSPTEPNIFSGATFKTPPVSAPLENIQWFHGRIWSLVQANARWIPFGMNYLFSLVLGLLLIQFFPKGLLSSISTVDRFFGRSLLWGILAASVVPFVIILLFATLIGIPLAFTLLALCIVTFASGKVIPILWGIKKWQSRKSRQSQSFGKSISLPSKKAYALGLFVFLILVKIPFVGTPISILSMLVGVGAVLKSNLLAAKEFKL